MIAEVRHAENSTFVAGSACWFMTCADGRRKCYMKQSMRGSAAPAVGTPAKRAGGKWGNHTFAWVDGSRAGAARCENGSQCELLSVSLSEDAFSRAAYEPQTGTLAFTTRKGALGTARAGEGACVSYTLWRWRAYPMGRWLCFRTER